jgi:undecaprenyl-diphosphatase
MNEYVQIIILAVVQGIAEFLPISSSGHLVIVEQLLGRWSGGASIAEGKEVEVFLHIGTLLAILVVYARDLWGLWHKPRLCAILIGATIPAAAVGLLLEDWFDQAFDAPIVAGFGLLMTAGLLTVGQRMERPRFNDDGIPWRSAMLVGCFQAVALIPGVSRSGSTIAGGLVTGMDRISATRFSFLLAIPVTGGAILLTAKKAWEQETLVVGWGPLLVGVVVSFLTGWVALEWLIRLISRNKLHWFAIYCAFVGCLTIGWCLTVHPAPDAPQQPPQLAGAAIGR